MDEPDTGGCVCGVSQECRHRPWTRVRTEGGKQRKAGESNDQVVVVVKLVTTIDLVWRVRHPHSWVGCRTYQEAICHPAAEDEHEIRDDAKYVGVDEELVSERPRR